MRSLEVPSSILRSLRVEKFLRWTSPFLSVLQKLSIAASSSQQDKPDRTSQVRPNRGVKHRKQRHRYAHYDERTPHLVATDGQSSNRKRKTR